MYEINKNKLLHEQGACTGFSHELQLMMHQKFHPLAALARSIADTSPTREKNPLCAPCPWSNLYVYTPSRKQNGKSNLSGGQ